MYGMPKVLLTDDQDYAVGEWLELCISNNIKHGTDQYEDLLVKMSDEDPIIKEAVINTLIETKDL